MIPLPLLETAQRPMRVMALRALGYCHRLFYLEEVERIHVANLEVLEGRELHATHFPVDEEGPTTTLELASERLGLVGRADCLQRHDGSLIPYELKRGRPYYNDQNQPMPWPGDRLQVIAYALLLEEVTGQPVPEARIRYHGANVTVRIPIDEAARADFQTALDLAHRLQQLPHRPPVADNPKLCEKCSLAPVCLPEEVRLQQNDDHQPLRLFPPEPHGTTLHVLTPGATVGVSGDAFVVRQPDGQEQRHPIHTVDAILLHGFSHLTVHALRKCAEQAIVVHWLTASGFHLASLTPHAGQVQRRIRQYQALSDNATRLRLAQSLTRAKIENQYRYLLRASRQDEELRQQIHDHLQALFALAQQVPHTDSADSLRGLEGTAAVHYFQALRLLLAPHVPEVFRTHNRNRRPPLDRFNALLSYGYGLLHTAVMRAVLAVGLEPAFGFFHTPRSAAYPLVLDLMELFRLILWDIPLIGSLNRNYWHPDADFQVTPLKVWLSVQGRRKAIELFEQRLQEHWKHPVLQYSLSYARTIELEVRLLEKEWSGEPGLFAQLRLR